MLCRALLTIIAISCTFSREIIVNAHDQGTQRLVQIKDLICVLLLSGLQKEDLDVNMLKKLQRHNVNIDDMNNENLRQECISKSTFSKLDSKIETTTEAVKEEKEQNNNINKATKAQLQTIIQYIIESKSDDQTVMGPVEETTKKGSENYVTLQVADVKPNLDEVVKYEALSTKHNYSIIDSMGNVKKPDLQKFIKLWNMYNNGYTKDSINRETAKPIFLQSKKLSSQPIAQKPNDNEKEIEMEYNMNKIIMDYVSKNKVNPTTASPPSTKNDIVDSISHQLDIYLAQNYNNKKIKNINEQIKTKNDPIEMLNLLINNVKIKQKTNDEVVDSFKEILKSKAKKYIHEILWTDEQLNDSIVHYAQITTKRPNPYQNGFQLGVIKLPELHKNNIVISEINGNVDQIIDENNNIKDVKIPVDIVKEIAESVKAIILKDLKNNLSTVTSEITTTKTTLEQEPTTFKQEKIQDTNSIMEKFMELFQQFKTMKEKTVISADTKLKTTVKKSIEHEYNVPLKLGYPPPMPPLNPYGVIMPIEHMTPIFANPYDQSSHQNTPFVHDSNKNNNLKSVHKITQVNIFHPKNDQQLVPLTIQTNSYEIPPLGIPVSKPINMVNQNIIVTTKNPYTRPKIDRQHGTILNHELDNNKRNRNDWLDTNDMRNRQRTYHDFNLNKFKDSNRDTRFMAISRERHGYTGDYNGNDQYRSGHYKPHFNKSDYDRMRLRNQDIKKFHERLERTEDSNTMDDREDCCRVKVASRQQLPLSNVKNRSRYDDTHFRNFLKTQQKVNDMLERILATKTKSDGPRSVETP